MPATSQAERGGLARRMTAESHGLIAKGTKNGVFTLPLSTDIAAALV